MTDDIVTRLHELANMGGFTITVETMLEAADEIERLRKIMRNVKAMEMCDANDPCEMCKEVAAQND